MRSWCSYSLRRITIPVPTLFRSTFLTSRCLAIPQPFIPPFSLSINFNAFNSTSSVQAINSYRFLEVELSRGRGDAQCAGAQRRLCVSDTPPELVISHKPNGKTICMFFSAIAVRCSLQFLAGKLCCRLGGHGQISKSTSQKSAPAYTSDIGCSETLNAASFVDNVVSSSWEFWHWMLTQTYI